MFRQLKETLLTVKGLLEIQRAANKKLWWVDIGFTCRTVTLVRARLRA